MTVKKLTLFHVRIENLETQQPILEKIDDIQDLEQLHIAAVRSHCLKNFMPNLSK